MSTKAKRPTYLIRVGMAHKRLFISVAIGLVAMLALPATPITRMLIGWDVGVLIYLVAAAMVMTQCSSVAQMKSNAAAQDEGAFAILILTVAAGMASLGRDLRRARGASSAPIRTTALYVALAIGTVVLSWTFIHTIFALHYAHEFYGAGEHKNGLRVSRRRPAGLLGLRLFFLRHRHDVPGLRRRRHPQVDAADGRRPRRAVVFLHHRRGRDGREHCGQHHSEIDDRRSGREP